MVKVCHVTSVHAPEDGRIFRRECDSLAKAGYDVTLVQQGGSYEKNGIHIVGFGEKEKSRLRRMLHTAKNAYEKAVEVDADLYHLHDPELLPYGLKLKKLGKKVIFDSHEDVPGDILGKEWIPALLRKPIARVYQWYEGRCFRRLDGAICVTPAVLTRMEAEGAHAEMVSNFPTLVSDIPQPAFRERRVVFPGLINSLWCMEAVIQAIDKIDDVTLELRSGNVDEAYLEKLKAMPGWKKVNFPGKVSHREVLELLSACACGIAVAEYCPALSWNLGTLGNTKIFEYMMAGIPVVCTDFTLWKEIVDAWQCGICVPPDDPDAIADAIRYLLDHPEEARRMGRNGRRAVEEVYNWSTEEKKLLAFYERIER
ncbi:glycosyltransferase [Dysosmobacter sp.]|uniref:glycosyltransferase n=1 Tax=Dysosmobacter sp. TaxID=2591382 RepID=UPI002A9B2F21|nr:glycosyltransferase [Dysosmobacter sp.]MDY5612330.1 glycosyltransferase [Dysosmobacter sp.]